MWDRNFNTNILRLKNFNTKNENPKKSIFRLRKFVLENCSFKNTKNIALTHFSVKNTKDILVLKIFSVLKNNC